MATMLRDFAVVVVVVHTHLRAVTLAMMTTRKAIHLGSFEYGAPCLAALAAAEALLLYI